MNVHRGLALLLLIVGAFALLPSLAAADAIRLDYEVTDLGGGLFDYEFQLVLDNSDGSWAPGQGWRWLIFGDSLTSTPLTAWVGDPSDLPVGPWTSYGSTSGGHNGPSFNFALDYWIPTSVGETLTWSGTSSADLPQGDLMFSTIAGTLNGAVPAVFTVAHRLGSGPVPEPATLALLGFGLAGLGWRRMRRRA